MRMLLAFLSVVTISGFAQTTILEHGLETLSLTGSTAIAGGGIAITGSGDIQLHKAYFNKETALDEINMNFLIRIDSLTNTGEYRFGIGKYSQTPGVTVAGTLVEFGGTAGNTTVFISRLNGTAATLALQYPLPFALAPGYNYSITIGKKIRNLIIEISSSDTSSYFYNDTLHYPSPSFGCMWGKPFVGAKSGSISILDFSLTTTLNTSPKLAVWGDSFVEGNSLESVEDRYVSLVQDSIGVENVSIMGRGGETSGTISNRFSKEHHWFAGAAYGLIAIGVNDNNFITWKSHILQFIDSLKNQNVVPIIATLSPRSDRLSFINQVNNWIRNDYNGAYIDISEAVSAAGTVWNTGLGLVDSIHPSEAGHEAIFNRIKTDAPYLFYETELFSINYLNETTNEPVAPGQEYATNSHFVSSLIGNGTAASLEPGTSLYFKNSYSGADSSSLYYVLSVPKRPKAPTNPEFDSGSGSFDWDYTPSFTTDSAYEFSLDSGLTWNVCLEKPLILPGVFQLQLRVKASIANFKGEPLIFNEGGVGVSALASNLVNDISVYPNPFNEVLFVEGATPNDAYELTTIDGKKLRRGVVDSYRSEIRFSGLSTGFYILTITRNNNTCSFKLLKE